MVSNRISATLVRGDSTIAARARNVLSHSTAGGQFLRFLVVGGTNTVVTTAAFYGLATVLPARAAFTIVYAAGLAFVVLVTPRYVFGSQSSWMRRLLLLAWYLGTYAVGIGVISLLSSVFTAPRIAVVIGTALVTAPLGFIGARLLVGGAGDISDTTTTAPLPRVTAHTLTHARDLRGALTAVELPDLEFVPQRVFAVYDVPHASLRGAHAHRTCSQFLICLTGGVSCLADNGSEREAFRLSSPVVGLHVPPMVWCTQWNYTRDAVLLVLASHRYDPDDYIRDYDEFLGLVSKGSPEAG